MHKPILIIVLAAALGCAHEEVADPVQHDWEHGLDAKLSAQIAPVGPIESDQHAYDLIRRREQQRALGTKTTGLELAEIVGNSSQVLASALALPLFKAGVYLGSPGLIDKGCAAAGRVTLSTLRSSGNVDQVLQACAALTTGRQSSDGCGEGQQKLREAYSLLAADRAQEAGKTSAEAVRLLRDRCPRIVAPLRTPVDPTTRGFLIVWTLHASDAPPATWLAGESIPATADSINEGFLRGVQAVRSVARNP